MQGVVKAFDPQTGIGSLLRETDLVEIDFAADAVAVSPFRFLRQGQRLNFDLDDAGRAVGLRLGSEGDMKTPTSAPPS